MEHGGKQQTGKGKPTAADRRHRSPHTAPRTTATADPRPTAGEKRKAENVQTQAVQMCQFQIVNWELGCRVDSDKLLYWNNESDCLTCAMLMCGSVPGPACSPHDYRQNTT